MSFGDSPTPPDPKVTSDTQFGYNKSAAQFQNANNSYNQSNPYGSLNYVADPNSPNGYRIDNSLNSQQQGLLNTRVGTQQTLGQTGNQLAQNSASMYSTPYDLNAATGQTAKLLNNWQQQYLQPIYNQQSSNLEAQLHNQGLFPGWEAYDNAKNLLARNQGDTTNQYLTKNEGQAFNQAVTNYQLPLQTLSGLFGASAPQSQAFQATPNATVQPPNYAQAAQNQYQGQQKQYENNMEGWGKVAGMAGSIIASPITGGLLAKVPGMFAGGWGGWGGGGGTSPGNIGGTGGNLGGFY